MRLLVTGGCGFIGTNFILMMREAHPDWNIVNLDLLTYAGNRLNLLPLEASSRTASGGDYSFAHGDIRDPEFVSALLEEHRIEAVVNFAAESHVDRSINDPAPFVSTNVQGAQNLLERARRHGVERFVQVSTDEVYGTLGPEGRFSESTPLAPNSPYSASKAGADLMVRAYVETYGLDAVITRCSNNYGPYQFPEKLIPLMFLKALRDEPLPVYGDGRNVRDWIFVDDHCRGVELALLKGRAGQAYNFGGNAELPNIELVKTLLDLLDKPHSLITFVKDRPGHDRRYAMDYGLASRELGFEPRVSFSQGLTQTIEWYRDNAAWLDQVQSGAYRDFMDQWYGERK
ncbi:dTDP-glucose 4,6-dehydratase [Paucidesulfovibrio longus]|uniref:dTDP-glucose 4,6-dehydratase n=1 Tax=Paucidesulfovibrio longus TaxID=889 RepID=UPI0003B3B5A1|nr:dTDP-glucose 4,6-dehydratase [Paucidesulfovibrio longus]